MTLKKRYSVSFPVTKEEYLSTIEGMAEALPWRFDLRKDLTLQDFARLVAAFHTVTRKSALAVGHLYAEAVKRFGQEAYQIFQALHYEESTLKNYRRIAETIDPSLWEEPISDRKFAAIAGKVKDPSEQRKWVERAKDTGVSADALRQEIQSDHEERGLIPRPQKATWVECDKCNGEGGFVVDQGVC